MIASVDSAVVSTTELRCCEAFGQHELEGDGLVRSACASCSRGVGVATGAVVAVALPVLAVATG